MEKEELSVFKTWDEPIADMAVGLLEQEGIAARKVSNMARSVYPFTFDGLGEIQIWVAIEDAEKAKEILEVRFS